MWNADSLVQDLNSVPHIHFLQWWPLHHKIKLEELVSIDILSISTHVSKEKGETTLMKLFAEG